MKEHIIETSIRLFGEKGFKETSIQDLMDELEVTKGTFYYYFKSKEQLLKDIHLQYIDRLIKHQEMIIGDESLSSTEKIHQMILSLITDIKEHGLRAKVFFREMRHLHGKNFSVVVKKRDQFRKNIENVIEDGMSNGEFRKDLPADIVAFGILGMANWSYFWFDPEGEVSDEQVSRIFHALLSTGLVPQS